MYKIIFESPTSVTVELACWQATNPNVSGFFATSFFAPRDTEFGGEPGDVFVIFKIGPKFYFGARFLF